MILIGSRALNEYVQLNRVLHDYDFICSFEELIQWNKRYGKYLVKTTEYSHIYDIDGEIIEIRNPEFLDKTDFYLLTDLGFDELNTKYGKVFLPPLYILYQIKKSTAECLTDEPKHKYDLDHIHKAGYYFHKDWFYRARLEETKARTDKSKKHMYDFFHKYHIPEYVKHDVLHQMFADLLDLPMPTYARLTIDDTNISEELFNKLTHDQKVSLMAEESLVLAMERWFLPRMIEDGINYRLIDMFYNNNEAMPTYKILKHVNITGLKGEAPYIVQFGRDNFFEIEKKWQEYKQLIKSKKGLPNWLFQEIFELRKKYRNKEQVGIV